MGESLTDALNRELSEELGIDDEVPVEGPVCIVDSIAPNRTVSTKHVVHIVFAGDLTGRSLEAVRSEDVAVTRPPPLRARRARHDRAAPADPALPAPLATGRSDRLPRRALGSVDVRVVASTAIAVLVLVGCSSKETSAKAEKCTDLITRSAKPTPSLSQAQARRYVKKTYCDRFAREGWVYDDGALSIDAQEWLDHGGKEVCATQTPSGPAATRSLRTARGERSAGDDRLRHAPLRPAERSTDVHCGASEGQSSRVRRRNAARRARRTLSPRTVTEAASLPLRQRQRLRAGA